VPQRLVPRVRRVLFVLRTRRPFFRSRPSRLLTASSLAVAAVALAIAYSPVAALLGLTGPPPTVLLALVFITALYVAVTEVTKWRFYRLPRERPGAAEQR
jgi:P-type Mg2+ transporter